MAIYVRGAREHNLRSVDVSFGSGLTVVTGVSGSGKTSLAFDTLYHEARRRFLAIYSLGSTGLRLSPAEVDEIAGLGPAVAVGQNLLNRNPASTLATASGLHPFLRLLYARFGSRKCAACGTELNILTEDEILEELLSRGKDETITLTAPLVRAARGSHRTLLAMLAATFDPESLFVDGEPRREDDLDPAVPHDIDVVVGRLEPGASATDVRRMLEAAWSLGALTLGLATDSEGRQLSRAPVCPQCGKWYGEIDPTLFARSCPDCEGAGCRRCADTGLHPEAAHVSVWDLNLPGVLALSVQSAREVVAAGELPAAASRLRREILRRLEALDRVGLGYISLDRPSPTLSRGESQRVRLAVALTSQLEDLVHVLDEPTIGQHPADVARVLPTFRELKGPVVYVEHDRAAAAMADHAIDLGPGAGEDGGRLVFEGSPAELWQADTTTGRYFSFSDQVAAPEARPDPDSFLLIRGAALRNLDEIDVPLPLGRITVVTGPSGSGKSTLVEDVLVCSLRDEAPRGCRSIDGPALKPVLVDQKPIGRNPRSNPATYTGLAPILRDYYAAETGLSASHFSFNRPEGACPACSGMGAVEVKMRYLPSTWIPCSECDGQRFSEEVLSAPARFGDQELSIADLLRREVAELDSLVEKADGLSRSSRRAARRVIRALLDVGLGYLPLGQPSPTLSGGEAQRVKLAKYLSRRSLANQLLVLDEPSTGLHPHDIGGLLTVLDRLARSGATIVVVEHCTDFIRAADWVVDLGPGAGPSGGRMMYAGPSAGLAEATESATAAALQAEEAGGLQPATGAGRIQSRRATDVISVRGASMHNLQDVDVDIPKAGFTVVTGVSGSGKSTLVSDVLEAEARRRFLESLTLYERQSTKEGPEPLVEEVAGLGVAIGVGPGRRLYDRRATVGSATEIQHYLALLLALRGSRPCPSCAGNEQSAPEWTCPGCGSEANPIRPRHFTPTTYAAACATCHGVGSLQKAEPEKLIIHPEQPLCDGAMYSPGFFPNGYLCEAGNGGYDMVQALAQRYGFDPATTPWCEMSDAARHAFLFGDPEPLEVTFRSRTGRTGSRTLAFPGFYGWIRDWDVGGTYTRTEECPDCGGGRLRAEYLAVRWRGHNMHELSRMPLRDLAGVVEGAPEPRDAAPHALSALQALEKRLGFLLQVGVGYLDCYRVAGSLSAGEAQRIKLASLLGSELTSLTVLLDEPSRGMHPAEVRSLAGALRELRDEGNTIIVVEHDPVLMDAAEHLIDMGPGAGRDGGRIAAQGRLDELRRADSPTGAWLRGERAPELREPRRTPADWMVVHGPRANNLRGEDLRVPLHCLVGICGVSGSGKSTLLIDTVGRALAPRKHTTSVAQEPIEPGVHDAITDAPGRVVLVDQVKSRLRSPASFLALDRPLRRLFAASDEAQARDLDESAFRRRCTACKGAGYLSTDLGFLPRVHTPCDTCRGSGLTGEAWEITVGGVTLPEVYGGTIQEAHERFGREPALDAPLSAAMSVGLGYLVMRQPGWALSGGEAQRLKIAKELCRRSAAPTLYILDEPTVGQHLEDVARLVEVLQRLVDDGGSVVVVEHHAHVLAACDWLVELGPGGGPDGGRIIAEGPPEAIAERDTPTAPYLRNALDQAR